MRPAPRRAQRYSCYREVNWERWQSIETVYRGETSAYHQPYLSDFDHT